MKRILSILMMVIAMMTVTTSVCAQAPNQKQRLSREQLAEKQAQYISRNLGLDEKTNAKFIEAYTDYQKEVWALGPRPHHKKGEMKTDAQTEQEIKQRFEMSEKILNIRQKYYKKYSQFPEPAADSACLRTGATDDEALCPERSAQGNG